MTGTTNTPDEIWTIEFPAQSIGQAVDIVRQHTPAGQMVPGVQEQGALGYMVISSDWPLIEAIRAHVGHEHAIVGKR